MSRIFLFVSVGGALGSLARYVIAHYIEQVPLFSFPLGTFMVNMIGCFIMGIFYALSEQFIIPAEWKLFLITGFCGGLTTFSTFTLENLNMLQTGQYLLFTLYSISSFILAIVFVVFGIALVRMLC